MNGVVVAGTTLLGASRGLTEGLMGASAEAVGITSKTDSSKPMTNLEIMFNSQTLRL